MLCKLVAVVDIVFSLRHDPGATIASANWSAAVNKPRYGDRHPVANCLTLHQYDRQEGIEYTG